MNPIVIGPGTSAVLHPLLFRLHQQYGYPLLDAQSLEGWSAAAGDAVLFFAEEPERYRETLDVAVILPELMAASPRPLRAAVLPPPVARAAAPRYGVRRWPALVFLRDGDYVGAIEGLLDWAGFLSRWNEMLAAPVGRPPTVGIAVAAAEGAAQHC